MYNKISDGGIGVWEKQWRIGWLEIGRAVYYWRIKANVVILFYELFED